MLRKNFKGRKEIRVKAAQERQAAYDKKSLEQKLKHAGPKERAKLENK